METEPVFLGTHAYFFLKDKAFTIPTAGTASPSAKPGATDTGWTRLGLVEDAAEAPVQSETIDIWGPVSGGGKIVKHDKIETKATSRGKLKVKDLSPLAIQILYRTAALTSASTQFNRLSGAMVKGWLKIQRYDQDNAQMIVEDLWCCLEITSDVQMGGSGLAEVEFEYEVLYSTLNTGTL